MRRDLLLLNSSSSGLVLLKPMARVRPISLHVWFFARCALGLCLIVLSSYGFAHGVQVSNAWARQPLPGVSDVAVFMSIQVNQSASLVAARSLACRSVELWQVSQTAQGAVKSQRVDSIPLVPGQVNELRANGYFLMLKGLGSGLGKPGHQLPVELRVRSQSGQSYTIRTQALVQGLFGS